MENKCRFPTPIRPSGKYLSESGEIPYGWASAVGPGELQRFVSVIRAGRQEVNEHGPLPPVFFLPLFLPILESTCMAR